MKIVPLAINVLALLLASAATILFITTRSAKFRAEAQLDQANTRLAYLDAKLTAERTAKDELQQRLTALDAALGETKGKLTAAELRVAEAQRDLAQTRNLLTVREQNEQALNREIDALKRDLDSSRQDAADLDRARTRIGELEQTVALLQGRVGLNATAVFSVSRRPAAIVTVGPENAFVVIDYGAKQGARPDQRLAIRRGTETLATVLISDVRDNFSIAQVEPASLRGALRKGDSAILIP
jgi:hypothetical protein